MLRIIESDVGKAVISLSNAETFVVTYYDDNGKEFYHEEYDDDTYENVIKLVEKWFEGSRNLFNVT